MQQTINRNLLKYAVQTAITCPRCGQILDVRSAVSVSLNAPANGDPLDTTEYRKEYIMCGKCWSKVRLAMHDLALNLNGNLYVLDGRELFPPTLAEAKRMMKAIGCTLKYDRDLEEYSVNFAGGKEATRCYTNCILDAIDTGRAMAAAAKGGR